MGGWFSSGGHLNRHAKLSEEALMAAPEVRHHTSGGMAFHAMPLDKPDHVKSGLEAAVHLRPEIGRGVVPATCHRSGERR